MRAMRLGCSRRCLLAVALVLTTACDGAGNEDSSNETRVSFCRHMHSYGQIDFALLSRRRERRAVLEQLRVVAKGLGRDGDRYTSAGETDMGRMAKQLSHSTFRLQQAFRTRARKKVIPILDVQERTLAALPADLCSDIEEPG